MGGGSYGDGENVLTMSCGDGCTAVWVVLKSLNDTL